MKKVIKVNI